MPSLAALITLLYYPLNYLFAPVIILAQVLFDLLVFTPYAIVLSVARDVYPIYVFVGATCLCALGVGYFARALSTVITRTFFTPRPQEKLPEELLPPRRAEVGEKCIEGEKSFETSRREAGVNQGGADKIMGSGTPVPRHASSRCVLFFSPAACMSHEIL